MFESRIVSIAPAFSNKPQHTTRQKTTCIGGWRAQALWRPHSWYSRVYMLTIIRLLIAFAWNWVPTCMKLGSAWVPTSLEPKRGQALRSTSLQDLRLSRTDSRKSRPRKITIQSVSKLSSITSRFLDYHDPNRCNITTVHEWSSEALRFLRLVRF